MKKIGWLVITVFAFLWVAKEILLPVGAAALYSREYMKLTVECDTAMEASWYYRQNEQISLESETVQLLVCHDYDKKRKLLLMSGLPEAYLSWLGLKSLEIYQRTPGEYVKQHRFKER